jgi:hypothetical protein
MKIKQEADELTRKSSHSFFNSIKKTISEYTNRFKKSLHGKFGSRQFSTSKQTSDQLKIRDSHICHSRVRQGRIDYLLSKAIVYLS